MPYDPLTHRRRSIRLHGYDYAGSGVYFVTVVTKGREALFEDEALRLIVEDSWRWLGSQYPRVSLDTFVLMPNHLHGILALEDRHGRGGSRTAPTDHPKHLGRLIGAFKTVSTKRINLTRATPGALVWQRNYYERIIRDEEELNRVRQYIIDNPLHWEDDPENPRQPSRSPAR